MEPFSIRTPTTADESDDQYLEVLFERINIQEPDFEPLYSINQVKLEETNSQLRDQFNSNVGEETEYDSVEDVLVLMSGGNSPCCFQNVDPQLEANDQVCEQQNSNVGKEMELESNEEVSVIVSGGNSPRCIQNFSDLKLYPQLAENIRLAGYSKPTQVQKYTIPIVLAGRDLMACAETGVSGKTAAFLIPIINRVINNNKSSLEWRGRQYPLALILSPTRELALEIFTELQKLVKNTTVKSAVLYGGPENYQTQISKLKIGCHILVATPGRLNDVIERGIVGLEECRFLILDEADRILDATFKSQVREIIKSKRGGMRSRSKRQTMLFSSSFPVETQLLANEFFKSDYLFLTVGCTASTPKNLVQKIVWVEEEDKRGVLMGLLIADGIILGATASDALTLVFVETKKGADDLTYYLNRRDCKAVAIHSDLNQFQRERNLDSFRSGEIAVLVATDVAARGLNIPNLKHVINFDLPHDVDEYEHRIGRTKRIGNVGVVTSFFNYKNLPLARMLADLIVAQDQVLPDWLERLSCGENRKAHGCDRTSRRHSRDLAHPYDRNLHRHRR